MVKIRQDHELPESVAGWGWRYHHLGIPTRKKLSPVLTNHIAIRARKYDNIVNDFISKNPDPIVINLGCGFDTR
jgi:O-methyltransferase involved in polyketide biosynthesis